MIVNQVNFFIKHLKDELEQLNLLETRVGYEPRHTGRRGRFQANQGLIHPRYQSFNNVQQGASSFQQRYQGYQGSQQQGVQNVQQGNQQVFQSAQQGNKQRYQQRKVQVFLFACPLGCQHSVPYRGVKTSKA